MSNLFFIPTPTALSIADSITGAEILLRGSNFLDPAEDLFSGSNGSKFFIFGLNIQYADQINFKSSDGSVLSISSGNSSYQVKYEKIGYVNDSGVFFKTGEGVWAPVSGFFISGSFSGFLSNYYKVSLLNFLGFESEALGFVKISDLTETGASNPGGSDGQIQYNNGGSFGGESQLYYDDVNNRLGVGTSSPTSTLHISGGIRLEGLPFTPELTGFLVVDESGVIIKTTSPVGTAINNASENRLVTVASTTTQLDAEQYLTFDGSVLYLGKGFKSEIATITPSSGVVAINMSSEILKKTTLDSNTTFSATGIAEGTSATLKILADGTDRTLAFASGWLFIGQKPVSIAASKTAILVLTSFGTGNADIVASYSVQD